MIFKTIKTLPMNTLHFLRKPVSVLVLIFFFAGIALQAQQAKYVFYFIGDGMGLAHVAAAEAYQAAINGGKGFDRMSFSRFPVNGLATTYAENRLITGSAAAGTALATGHKTTINTIGMDPSREQPMMTIAERAKRQGKKVGIISSVSIDHATPASFYAHQPSRNMYYRISRELPGSGFDFFGGGAFKDPLGGGEGEPSAFDLVRQQGFTITHTRAAFDTLVADDLPVMAMGSITEGSGALRYAIDQTDQDIPLEDFVAKAINLLDNDKGFFIMCEEGKIDWAAHANDAATMVQNVMSLSKAVDQALAFYKKHPDETLIVVTADHETGGLALGYALMKYDSRFALLSSQKMSMEAFSIMADTLYAQAENPDFEMMMQMVGEYFGLTDAILTNYDRQQLHEAYLAMTGKSEQAPEALYLHYGGYNPVAVTAAKMLAHKAGLGWSTWSHTAIPVPVFAIGAGQELFDGYYDNTDIPKKISRSMGVEN